MDGSLFQLAGMNRARRAAIAAACAAMLTLPGCSLLPQSRGDERGDQRDERMPTTLPGRPQTPAQRPADTMCTADLTERRAVFTPLPDRYYGAGCSTLGSVQIASLASDESRIAIASIGPVACDLANTFADWARYGVDRAARAELGSPLARIETMGSYSCRNVAGTDRRSAHSTANAIDIGAFVLEDGRRISVKDGWDGRSVAERNFLRIVHRSACKRFGTVLGPAYNAAHADHLHLEAGDGSFCR
jgi:hypothetical protein